MLSCMHQAARDGILLGVITACTESLAGCRRDVVPWHCTPAATYAWVHRHDTASCPPWCKCAAMYALYAYRGGIRYVSMCVCVCVCVWVLRCVCSRQRMSPRWTTLDTAIREWCMSTHTLSALNDKQQVCYASAIRASIARVPLCMTFVHVPLCMTKHDTQHPRHSACFASTVYVCGHTGSCVCVCVCVCLCVYTGTLTCGSGDVLRGVHLW